MPKAPNRSNEVANIVNSFPECLIVHKSEADERRRQFLRPIVEQLNSIDNDKWGVLIKTDKNPDFIPVDIIVWKDTLEHIDVNTAKLIPGKPDMREIKPVWVNHGVIPPNKQQHWLWLDIAASGIENLDCASIPNPIPPIPQPANCKECENKLEECQKKLAIATIPPVDYSTFVAKESFEIQDAYVKKHGHLPSPSDMYHNAWRRLVEKWSHEYIIANI